MSHQLLTSRNKREGKYAGKFNARHFRTREQYETMPGYECAFDEWWFSPYFDDDGVYTTMPRSVSRDYE